MELGWFYSGGQIARYIPGRITTLKPPRSKLTNPWTIIRSLDSHQWSMFLIGWLSWAWDAFDFFTVSLCLTEIAEDFGKEPSDVSWGITVTLMLRSVGALISGSLSDRYGRKYLMVGNLFLFIILELASGFCNSLGPFLAVRALYGICMGGLLGPAASTALEDLPYDLVASPPDCFNKAMQSGTCSLRSSIVRSCPRHLTDGEVSSGSELDLQSFLLRGDSISQRRITFKSSKPSAKPDIVLINRNPMAQRRVVLSKPFFTKRTLLFGGIGSCLCTW